MVEGLVGVGLLAALGLGVMKLSDSQKKAARGQKQVSELPRTMVIIKQLTSDKSSCEANFKGKDVKSNLAELKDAESKVRFKQGDVIGKGEYRLTDIKLDGYSEDTNRVRLSLSFDKLQEGAASSKVNRFTFIHAEATGGKISKCLDPSEMSSESLAKRFCKDIDPAQNDNCEDNLNNLTLNVKEIYCGKGHPFLKFDEASGKCLPLDADKACGSGYVQGYDAKGELVCYNPPGSKPTPPDPSKTCTPPASKTEAITRASSSETRDGACPSGQKGELKETRSVEENGTRVTTWSCPSSTAAPVSSVSEKWAGTFSYGSWKTLSSTCKASGPPPGTKLWTCSYGSDSMYWYCRIENNLPSGVSVQTWTENGDYSQRATLKTPESVCASGSAWAESYVTFSQGVCN